MEVANEKTSDGDVRVEVELGNGRRIIVSGEVTTDTLIELVAAIDAGVEQ